MAKKVLFCLILIIVFISLNWFKVIRAQGTDNLSEEEKKYLYQKYGKKINNPAGEDSEYYQTPEIFGDSDKLGSDPAIKNDTLDKKHKAVTLNAHQNAAKSYVDGRKPLPDFDDLRPFGMDLFEAEPEMAPPVDIASADDYILGPGDNIIIYLWGRVEQEYNLVFDREGKVFIPKAGEIVGWGLTLEQFKARAQKRLSKVYSEFDLTISLGKIRSIRVYVTGEVNRPGAYTVSSLMSLFNVLFTAGGPNDRGSMRNIKLVRQGEEKAIIDLYEFLLKGDIAMDNHLQTGDVIFVPVAGPKVAARGEIKRPAIYELTGGQTTLELLSLAGNPTPAAHLDRVMLERIGDKKEWEIIDLSLNPASDKIDDINLRDGDRLTIYSIFDAKTNMVAVCGKVKHPGYYERNDSTHISDLIRQSQLQPYDVYYERANLFRRHHDWRREVIPINIKEILAGNSQSDLLLKDQDSLHIYGINEIEWDRYIYIEGEVKNPGAYSLYDKMTASDLIFLAGSYTSGACRYRTEIARLDSLGKVSLINGDSGSNDNLSTFLKENDHVYVRRIPEWETDQTITIDGEVMYPGKYTLANREETMYHLLQRAGGFTENAFPRGIIFKRQSIKEKLSRLNIQGILDKTRPIIEDSLGQKRHNEIFLIDTTAMTRIIIDVDKIMASNGTEGDVILEPNDYIYVPKVPMGISIMGAVSANGTLKYIENKSVREYIKHAGGFTEMADKKGTRLIKATGKVFSGKSTLSQKVFVGDMVVVPAKIEKERNWLKVLTTALTATTGVLTSVYIVSKL